MSKHYCCGVDYQHELEEGLADVYDSVEALKAARECWKNCGIVEFILDEKGEEVSHRWIEEQDLYWGQK